MYLNWNFFKRQSLLKIKLFATKKMTQIETEFLLIKLPHHIKDELQVLIIFTLFLTDWPKGMWNWSNLTKLTCHLMEHPNQQFNQPLLSIELPLPPTFPLHAPPLPPHNPFCSHNLPQLTPFLNESGIENNQQEPGSCRTPNTSAQSVTPIVSM